MRMCYLRSPCAALLAVGLLSSACKDHDEARAVREFRDLRAAHTRLLLEAARDGDTVTLARLGQDKAIASILHLAQLDTPLMESIRAGDIEDVEFTTEPRPAFVTFHAASTLYIVPFVRDEDRWIIADFAGPSWITIEANMGTLLTVVRQDLGFGHRYGDDVCQLGWKCGGR